MFIDDFHYIPRDVQEILTRQIKEAINKSIMIVCASVPKHTEDVLRANTDLRGRIVTIDLDFWPADALRKIPERGFAALNVTLDEATIQSLISEVAGSPQLMQSICLNACLECGVRSKNEESYSLPSDTVAPIGHRFLWRCLLQDSGDRGLLKYSGKLEEGPKTRGTDRNQYALRDGAIGDVYTILLRAIVLDPPSLHFRYSELQDRIKEICENDTPVGSSVTGRVCILLSLLMTARTGRSLLGSRVRMY